MVDFVRFIKKGKQISTSIIIGFYD
jgi:hypothetical protein